MKQKIIKTDKATLLAVELDKFTDVDCPIEIHGNKLVSSQSKGIVINTTKLPEGNWKLLSRLPDITEEQWKGVVDYFTTDEEFGKEDVFRDYLDKSFFDTATESGVSILQANEICFENHLGREPDSESYLYRDALGITSNYWSDLLEWQEAQSKVWDKECCYLFIKVD